MAESSTPKLINLSRLSEFWTKVKDYIDTKLGLLNTKVNATIWRGKEADIDAAVASGAIIPGFTQVIIEDDSDTTLEFCTQSEIENLFK